MGNEHYTAYYFSESQVPLSDIRRGIRYSGQSEVEEQYSGSLYSVVGLLRDLYHTIQNINRTSQPVMVFGEEGTCKEQAVNYLYLQSDWWDSAGEVAQVVFPERPVLSQ